MFSNYSQASGIHQFFYNNQINWLIIDANVEEYQTLIEGAIEGIAVFVLDSNQDGIQQITDLLQQQPTSNITLVAHGFPGGLRLGNTTLELNNLAQYAESLSQWFIGDQAQLTLLSCRVAAGDAGAEFVEQLQALTQATVTASAYPQGQGQWLPKASQVLSSKVLRGYSQQLAGSTDGDVILATANSLSPHAPVLTVDGSLTFRGTAKLVAPTLAIAANGNTTLDGARVAIGTGFDAAGDRLGIQGQGTATSGTIGAIAWTYEKNTGILTFSGNDSIAAYEAALQQVVYYGEETVANGNRSIDFSLGGSLANPENGHFYEFISNSGIAWNTAKTTAESLTYFGLQGYLATITSANEQTFVATKVRGNGWIGASDAATEGDWQWVTGPEAGTQFWSGGTTGSSVDGNYSNWMPVEEPNNSGNEDYAHIIGNPVLGALRQGRWNDLPNSIAFGTYAPLGYVVEYGGLPNDPTLQITGSVSLQVDTTVTLAPDSTNLVFQFTQFVEFEAMDEGRPYQGNFAQFNEVLYRLTNLDVQAAIAQGTFESGWQHYTLFGANEGRSPLPLNVEIGGLKIGNLFDETYYLSQYADVAVAVSHGEYQYGFEHFLKHGITEGRNPSSYFDESYYLSTNEDVQAAVQAGTLESGFQHYLLYGHVEDRNPSELFQAEDYLFSNPDVQAAIKSGAFQSGFDHYIEYGAKEGRLNTLLFEEGFYVKQNADVAEAIAQGVFASGLEHYVQYGQKEGRNPGSLFDEAFYLGSNADVVEAVQTAILSSGMEHFFRYGRAEERTPFVVETSALQPF